MNKKQIKNLLDYSDNLMVENSEEEIEEELSQSN